MRDGITISFYDVAKRYDLRVVFRAVSGEATPGTVLAITGPNGSGKSTLLQILCGLVRPTRGAIRHAREDGGEIDRGDWRHHVGIVAPAMAMYEELDALENLRFFAGLRAIGDAERRCRQCLEEVGLDAGRTTAVRGFSTGMQQRLKIAQAMLHRPQVLLLDEPGSNLDPDGRRWLDGWVRSRVEAGVTVVLATNDGGEIAWGNRHVALPG